MAWGYVVQSISSWLLHHQLRLRRWSSVFTSLIGTLANRFLQSTFPEPIGTENNRIQPSGQPRRSQRSETREHGFSLVLECERKNQQYYDATLSIHISPNSGGQSEWRIPRFPCPKIDLLGISGNAHPKPRPDELIRFATAPHVQQIQYSNPTSGFSLPLWWSLIR